MATKDPKGNGAPAAKRSGAPAAKRSGAPAAKRSRARAALRPDKASLLFQHFGAARGEIVSLAGDLFRPLGLGLKQALLLRFVARERRTSASAFARETHTDSAALVRLVDSLIARGLVAREPDPDDRRRWIVVLTAAGTKKAAQVERVRKRFAERLAGALSDEEVTALVGLIGKIVAAVRATPRPLAPRSTKRRAVAPRAAAPRRSAPQKISR